MNTYKSKSNIKPFGMRDKVGYMLGDLGNDFTFIFASTYVMVFYSKVMGISTHIIGTMFLIARCLDAFTDIGMGRIVDVSKPGKDGKFRCWIRRMCGFVALSSFMMYQSFLQDASMNVKIAYMFITYILWGSIFYTSINIPYGSMASVISNEPKHRSSLSVFRSMGGILAMIIINVVAPLVVYYRDADGNQVVHAGHTTILAGVFSLCAILCYFLCYFMTTERVKPEKKEADINLVNIPKSTLFGILKELFTDRAFLGLILSALIMLFATLFQQGINNYLFIDYFNSSKALSIYSVLILPATLLLLGVSTPITVRFGKKESGTVCFAITGVVYLMIAFMKIQNVWVYIGVSFIAILARQCFSMQAYALVTDVIDNREVQKGSRDDGMVYGIYSFSRKIGQAIAGGISGWALAGIGYDSLAVVQTEAVKDGIYQIAAIFPGISFILGALILGLLYPLTKKRVESNVAELERRRGISGV
ncbi:MAG: MFS transporter [Lachnospiraceae bacterium]